jgi:hypothetical protein
VEPVVESVVLSTCIFSTGKQRVLRVLLARFQHIYHSLYMNTETEAGLESRYVASGNSGQRYGTGRARKRDRLRACLKRCRHILHVKVDEEDQYERLRRVLSEEEHKVESSRLVTVYYLDHTISVSSILISSLLSSAQDLSSGLNEWLDLNTNPKLGSLACGAIYSGSLSVSTARHTAFPSMQYRS